VLNSRAAAVGAGALACVLASALAVTSLHASHTETALRGQLARLDRQLAVARTGAMAVNNVFAAPTSETLGPPGAAPREAAVKKLLLAPVGFDACARMEAADAAVLSTLKR
jgi:hypothetical protein